MRQLEHVTLIERINLLTLQTQNESDWGDREETNQNIDVDINIDVPTDKDISQNITENSEQEDLLETIGATSTTKSNFYENSCNYLPVIVSNA